MGGSRAGNPEVVEDGYVAGGDFGGCGPGGLRVFPEKQIGLGGEASSEGSTQGAAHGGPREIRHTVDGVEEKGGLKNAL